MTGHWFLRAVLMLLALCGSTLALAHENLPASLLLRETVPQRFEVRWRLPQTQGAAPQVTPQFPADCTATTQTVEVTAPGARLQRWDIQCGTGLKAGARIAFDGLGLTMIDVLTRVSYLDGSTESHIARPRAPEVFFDQASTHSLVESLTAYSYFGLGVEHILTGIDHLLFVLCLILLVPGRMQLLKTITAFTVAHSVTLALATLDVVHVPSAPVEATIALSILFLARVLALRDGDQDLALRWPWGVAFVFGLLHGFGFAGALSEVGLPQGDIPLALLLFNLGVEAGQLAFVLAVLPLLALARQPQSKWPRWAASLPVYAVGAVSGLWFLQRLMPVLGLR